MGRRQARPSTRSKRSAARKPTAPPPFLAPRSSISTRATTQLRLTQDMLDRLVDIFRDVKPAFVLTHARLKIPTILDHPVAAHLAQEARVVAQALGHKPSAGSISYPAPPVFLFEEPHQPEQCNFKPDVLLNIDRVWEKKRAAFEVLCGAAAPVGLAPRASPSSSGVQGSRNSGHPHDLRGEPINGCSRRWSTSCRAPANFSGGASKPLGFQGCFSLLRLFLKGSGPIWTSTFRQGKIPSFQSANKMGVLSEECAWRRYGGRPKLPISGSTGSRPCALISPRPHCHP